MRMICRLSIRSSLVVDFRTVLYAAIRLFRGLLAIHGRLFTHSGEDDDVCR